VTQAHGTASLDGGSPCAMPRRSRRGRDGLLRAASCALATLAFTAPSARAVSSSAVIGEVYASGGLSGAAWRNDYVVLYNLGATAVNLGGWSLQIPNPAGGPWSVAQLGGALLPGHFYLVQLASGGTGGAVLPAPDAGGGYSLNPAAGTVALFSTSTPFVGACASGASLVDLVGWGTAACSETAPASAPDTANAIKRAVPCVDTDDNAADFLLSAASPENSAVTYSCANHPPVIQPIANQVLAEGSVRTVQAVASDADSNPLTYAGLGPAWFTVNPATGVCTLAPDLSAAETSGGVYTATVTVSDGLSFAKASFTITVTDLTTSANLPYSGTWPGGVNMATGELSLALPPDLGFGGGSAQPQPEPERAYPQPVPDRAYPIPLPDSPGPLFPPSPCAQPQPEPDRAYPQPDPDRAYPVPEPDSPASLFPPTPCAVPQPEPDRSGAFFPPTPCAFAREYHSLIAREGVWSGHAGTNWLGTYDWGLFTVAGGIIVVCDNGGEAMRFMPVAGGPATQLNHLEERLVLGSVVSPAGGTVWRLYRSGTDRVYEFDGATGHLDRIFDPHGNALTCAYGPNGLLSAVSDGVGRALSFTYDPLGHLLTVGDGMRSVSYGYTGDLLTSFTDAAGHVTHYAYAAGPYAGLLSAVTEPAGNTPWTFAYDAQGRVASRLDAANNAWRYSYGPGIESAMMPPTGETWHAALDGGLHLTAFTDGLARTASVAYDALGRPVSSTRPLGDATTWSYDAASGFVNAVTMADGSRVTHTFVAQAFDVFTHYLVAGTGFPDNTVESWSYDAAGDAVAFTDRGGQRWMRTFTAQGQVLSETNPAGGVGRIAYDARLNPVSFTDPAGNLTSWTLDAFDRPLTLTHADATRSSVTYDALGDPLSYTDESGAVWSRTYDANRSLLSTTDPLAHLRTFTHDALDRLVSDSDPLGGQEHFTYDADGRPVSAMDRSGRTVSQAYDAAGQVVRATDGLGNATSWTYDPDGRAVSVIDPLGQATQLAFDVRDRVTQFRDPVGAVAHYGYDVMSRLTTLAGPLGHSESFAYDARGGLIGMLDVFAHTGWTRNALGEATGVADPTNVVWTAAYDAGGRPVSGSDPLQRQTSLTYDTRGRVAHEANPVGTEDAVYDPVGRLVGLNFSDAVTLSFTRDAAGRVVGATGGTFAYDAADRLTASNGITFTRDPDGRLLSETFAAGKTVSYAYDAAGRVTQVTDWLNGATAFTYDAGGHVTGIMRPNGTNATYAYDAAGRLTQWVEKAPGPVGLASVTLARDTLGRVVQALRNVPVVSMASADSVPFSYDPAGQTLGRTFDGLGRLLADGARTFQWDAAGRLTHYAIGNESPTFTYDAFGRELTRNDVGVVRTLVWNYGTASPSLGMIEPGTTGAIIVVCMPSGAPLYQVDATGARTFYHFDERGDLVLLTNDAGAEVGAFAYSPTGQAISTGLTPAPMAARRLAAPDQVALSATDVPFTFAGATGAVHEGAGGLVRLGGELYDPTLARTVSGGHGALFEISDYSFDIEQTLNIGSQSSGAGAGKITFNPFTITRTMQRCIVCDAEAGGGAPGNGVGNNGYGTNGFNNNGYGTNGVSNNGYGTNGVNNNGYGTNGFNDNGVPGNGMGAPLGWYDPQGSNGEIGDVAGPIAGRRVVARLTPGFPVVGDETGNTNGVGPGDPGGLHSGYGTIFTTKIDWSGPGDEGPEEGVTFVYGKFGVRYLPQPGPSPPDPRHTLLHAGFRRWPW